jgi:hypothetical protein
VYKNINASKMDDDLIDTFTTCFGVGDIDLQELYRDVMLLGDRQKLGMRFRSASSRSRDDISSPGGQFSNRGGADATCASCDKTDFPL